MIEISNVFNKNCSPNLIFRYKIVFEKIGLILALNKTEDPSVQAAGKDYKCSDVKAKTPKKH